jgi:hypothetical protein
MIRRFVVKFSDGTLAMYEGVSAAQIRRAIEQWTTMPFTFVVFSGEL